MCSRKDLRRDGSGQDESVPRTLAREQCRDRTTGHPHVAIPTDDRRKPRTPPTAGRCSSAMLRHLRRVGANLGPSHPDHWRDPAEELHARSVRQARAQFPRYKTSSFRKLQLVVIGGTEWSR